MESLRTSSHFHFHCLPVGDLLLLGSVLGRGRTELLRREYD